MRRRQFIGSGLNGVCGAACAVVLGFTPLDWQWWLIQTAVIVARINGQVSE